MINDKSGLTYGSDGTAYVIVIAGQSNGTDRFTIVGNLPSNLQAILPGVNTFYKATDTVVDDGSWVNMQAGQNTTYGAATNLFSIGVSMGYRLLNTYNISPYIIPTAVAGTYIYQAIGNDWNINDANMLYNRMIVWYLRPALSKLTNNKFRLFFVWVHGESDSDSTLHANAYKSNLSSFIIQSRIDSGFANAPFIITELSQVHVFAAAGPASETIRSAQKDVTYNVPNTYLIPIGEQNKDLQADHEHYTPATAIDMGNRLADLISNI